MGNIDLSDVTVEPLIEELVHAMNKVPYITTLSSCEGHYDKPRDCGAHVIFEIAEGSEGKLERLMKEVLSETCKRWSDCLVQLRKEYSIKFAKEYYVVPDGKNELEVKYELSMNPFDMSLPAEQKREYTDAAIGSVLHTVKKYISKPSRKRTR